MHPRFLRWLEGLPCPTHTRERVPGTSVRIEPLCPLPPFPRQRQTSCEAGTQSQGSRRSIRRDSQVAEGKIAYFDSGEPRSEDRGSEAFGMEVQTRPLGEDDSPQ